MESRAFPQQPLLHGEQVPLHTHLGKVHPSEGGTSPITGIAGCWLGFPTLWSYKKGCSCSRSCRNRL